MTDLLPPKRADRYLDQYDCILTHYTGGNPHADRLQLTKDILSNGIYTATHAKRVNTIMKRKVLKVPPFEGPSKVVLAWHFPMRDSGMPKPPKAAKKHFLEMMKNLNDGSFHPTIIFRKAARPNEYDTVRFTGRVHPRFILGIVLPRLDRRTQLQWINALKEYGKPLYNFQGKLVWGPKSAGWKLRLWNW